MFPIDEEVSVAFFPENSKIDGIVVLSYQKNREEEQRGEFMLFVSSS